MADIFPGRLAIQQRVFPNYRVPFFSSLAAPLPWWNGTIRRKAKIQ